MPPPSCIDTDPFQIAAKRKEVEYLQAEHDSLSVEYARFEQVEKE